MEEYKLLANYKNDIYSAIIKGNNNIILTPLDKETSGQQEVNISELNRLYRHGTQCDYKGKTFWIINESNNQYTLFASNKDEITSNEEFYQVNNNDYRAIISISEAENIKDVEKDYIILPESEHITDNIRRNVLNGLKIPHQMSFPVLYKKKNNFYLAVFVYFYGIKELINGKASRPTLWAIADLDTGKIIHRYNTMEKDFSSASYNQKYNIITKNCPTNIFETRISLFTMLDKVIHSIRENGEPDLATYKTYLNTVIDSVPAEFERFYLDLSYDYSNSNKKKSFWPNFFEIVS